MTDDIQDTKKDEKEPVNWFAELRGLALMLLAVLCLHSFVAKPFYIPSTSMMPNLLVGDRLIVSKYPYGWNWSSVSFHLLPRSDWRVWADTPEYGDIVIPVHPERDEDYIKRVVGMPGDRIAVVNGQIILNGQPIPQEVEPPRRLSAEDYHMCDGVHCMINFEQYRTTVDGKDVYEVPVLRETMPNGATYLVIDHIQGTMLDDYEERTIPEGHVFVMGDNRDHSADSREDDSRGLMGPVPLENIGGRAEFITFSLDGSTSLNPISWWTSMRDGRAWSTLRPALVERGQAPEAD